jgi:thioesterase domain-containing protein
MLAYEIAQQLAAMGEGVELLALIDTPAMEELPQALADGADIVSYVAALLGYPMAAADLRPLARDAQIACLIERCAEALPPGITVSDLDLHLRVFAANTDAMRAYRIAPYRQAGRILYFRARERTAQTPAHPERPWLARLGERLELIQVSGNHLTMLRSPHVEAIAARLNRPLTGEETSAD